MALLEKFLVAIILPPTCLLLLKLVGIRMMRANNGPWRNGGLVLSTFSVVLILLLNTPFVSRLLIAPLEPYPLITVAQLQQVQATVILGGGTYYGAPEYGGDTVGRATLERIRYGARLARQTGLPILVTGGAPSGGRPEADLMAEVLEGEFGVKVRWVERVSRNTAKNAFLSVPLLTASGIRQIALVSHGLHIPRAIRLFENERIWVTPAPTQLTTKPPSLLADLLPGSLGRSSASLHKYLGMLFDALSTR